MWSSRLFWKLFLVYAGLNLTLAVAFLILVSRWQRAQILDEVQSRLHDTAVLLRSHVADQQGPVHSPAELQTLVVALARQTGTRMTLVAADGTVLADSNESPQSMENHGQRQEIVEAAAKGVGSSTRMSPTLGIRMSYLALRGKPDSVAFVRVAMPLDAIDREAASMQRLMWLLAASIGLLAAGMTWAVAAHIMKPLKNLTEAADAIQRGDFTRRVLLQGGDELHMLGAAFNRMQDELAARVSQLEQHGERLATVLRSMAEGVIVIDADERLLLANDASQRMLDFSTADVVGRPLQEVTRNRVIAEALHEALESNKPQERELEIPGKQRRALTLRAIRLSGKSCQGAVAVLRDLTELRSLENMRREFVANVSNELKTPLAAIKAYAETLRLGAMSDHEHNLDFVARIEEQAERLHQLIVDLLSLARVESGRQALEVVDLPVAGLIAACVAQHANAAAAKRIQLNAFAPRQPILVRADEEGLRTILNNLVDNAIKYTPDQGKVYIRWWTEDREAVLEVEDTGIGIAAEEQQRVFERFYRVDKARSRQLGGTGLGLAIVKHLAQALSGSVQLASELGKGSRFRVRLPLA
jgi:two-component system phosphate regulon sensor histidine kinase PhoR